MNEQWKADTDRQTWQAALERCGVWKPNTQCFNGRSNANGYCYVHGEADNDVYDWNEDSRSHIIPPPAIGDAVAVVKMLEWLPTVLDDFSLNYSGDYQKGRPWEACGQFPSWPRSSQGRGFLDVLVYGETIAIALAAAICAIPQEPQA